MLRNWLLSGIKGAIFIRNIFYCILELFQEFHVKTLFDFNNNSMQWVAVSKRLHKQGNQSSESLASLFKAT